MPRSERATAAPSRLGLFLPHGDSQGRACCGFGRYVSYYWVQDGAPVGPDAELYAAHANLGPPLFSHLPVLAAAHSQMKIPMLYTPGGPVRPPTDGKYHGRGQWYSGKCPNVTCTRGNATSNPPILGNQSKCQCGQGCDPSVCYVPSREAVFDAFEDQAHELVPFVVNGTITGIFFGTDCVTFSLCQPHLVNHCQWLANIAHYYAATPIARTAR